MGGVLLSQDRRGVATVTLNRPERRNAFDDALIATVAGRPISPAVMAHTAEAIAEARASVEGREELAAFLEKRKPNFRA